MTVKAMILRPVDWTDGERKRIGDYISLEEFNSIPVRNRKALVSTGKIALVEVKDEKPVSIIVEKKEPTPSAPKKRVVKKKTIKK